MSECKHPILHLNTYVKGDGSVARIDKFCISCRQVIDIIVLNEAIEGNMERNDDEVKFWYSKMTDPSKWLEDNRENEYIELKHAAEVLAKWIALEVRDHWDELNLEEKQDYLDRALEELKK